MQARHQQHNAGFINSAFAFSGKGPVTVDEANLQLAGRDVTCDAVVLGPPSTVLLEPASSHIAVTSDDAAGVTRRRRRGWAGPAHAVQSRALP